MANNFYDITKDPKWSELTPEQQSFIGQRHGQDLLAGSPLSLDEYLNEYTQKAGTPAGRQEIVEYNTINRPGSNANITLPGAEQPTGGLNSLDIDPSIKGLYDLIIGERDKERAAEQAAIEEQKKSLAGLVGGLGENIRGLRESTISDITKRGQDYLSGFRERQKSGLDELSNILQRESEQAFSESAPDILEQLAGRGLLRSTYTGEALGKEKARLAQQAQNELARTALAGRQQEEDILRQIDEQITGARGAGLGFEQQLGLMGLQGQQGLMGLDLGSLQELGRYGMQSLADLGTAGIQRNFSQQESALDRALAERIGNIQAGAARSAGTSQGLGSLLGGILGGTGLFGLFG